MHLIQRLVAMHVFQRVTAMALVILEHVAAATLETVFVRILLLMHIVAVHQGIAANALFPTP